MDSAPMGLRQAIRKRLEETLGPVPTSDLKAHLTRDIVFLVAPTVSLLDCAVSVAMDEVVEVKALLDSHALRKPSRREKESMAAGEAREVLAVVVDPFVLVQSVGSGPVAREEAKSHGS